MLCLHFGPASTAGGVLGAVVQLDMAQLFPAPSGGCQATVVPSRSGGAVSAIAGSAKIGRVGNELAVQAAANNALWCDAVCRAHGLRTSFETDAWISHDAVPSLYPNLVTLSAAGVAAQMRRVVELRQSFAVPGWAVKDSFNVLDLVPQGFEPLFNARWLCRAPLTIPDACAGSGLAVSRVDSQQGLAGWEQAWRGEGPGTGSAAGRTFPPSLLDDPEIAFVWVTDGADVVAGLIANRAAQAIGISNMFCRRDGELRFAILCLAEASVLWPGLPLVTYASGGELVMLQRQLGFRDSGELRVWRYVWGGLS